MLMRLVHRILYVTLALLCFSNSGNAQIFQDDFSNSAYTSQNWGLTTDGWVTDGRTYSVPALPNAFNFSALSNFSMNEFRFEVDILNGSDGGILVYGSRNRLFDGVVLVIRPRYGDWYWHTRKDGRFTDEYKQFPLPLASGANFHVTILARGKSLNAYISSVSSPKTILASLPRYESEYNGGTLGVYQYGLNNTMAQKFANVKVFLNPAAYSINDLGTLNGDVKSEANSINNLGQVVGTSYRSDGAYTGFVWSPNKGKMEPIAGLSIGGASYAQSINDSGYIAGWAVNFSPVYDHPLAIFPEGPRDLGVLPGGTWGIALSSNRSKQVVGTSSSSFGQQPFVWSPSTRLQPIPLLRGGSVGQLSWINDNGVAVGWSEQNSDGYAGNRAVIWSSSTGMISLGALPGGYNSYAHMINALGDVVGDAFGADLHWHGFYKSPRSPMREVTRIPGFSSWYAHALNNGGDVVGCAENGAELHPYLWKPDGSFVDLNTTISAIAGSMWYLERATGINDRGQIVGFGQIGGQRHAFLLTPSSPLLDSDGDGIPDDWEINGYDYNGVHVDLHAMGANPYHKDVFVMVDYMANQNHSHKLTPEAKRIVVDAFRDAPVANPDGQNGITLHINYSRSIPEIKDTIGFSTGEVDQKVYDWSELTAVKDTNSDDVKAKLRVFHYCLMGHFMGGLGKRGGISNSIPSHEFIISLGAGVNSVGSTWQQAGVFMHELGHNLGLHHGGNDDINHKPNYLSVMNYSFLYNGLIFRPREGFFDYSRTQAPSLDETNLDERVGLNGGPPLEQYGTRWFLLTKQPNSPKEETDFVNQPINWNGNKVFPLRDIIENHVSTDINGDGQLTTLNSFNDWLNIDLRGGVLATGALPAFRWVVSDEADVQVLSKIPPIAPSGLVLRTSGRAIRLSWIATGPSEERTYRAYRSADGINFARVGSPSTALFADTRLNVGVKYHYYVTAVSNQGIESEPSEVQSYLVR